MQNLICNLIESRRNRDNDAFYAEFASTQLSDRLRLSPGSRLLDIGTGDGVKALSIARAVGIPSSNVDRVDIGKVTDPDITWWDGTTLPYAAHSFELVTLIHVLHHVTGERRLRRVAEEALRVLSPTGVLMFVDIDNDPESKLVMRRIHEYWNKAEAQDWQMDINLEVTRPFLESLMPNHLTTIPLWTRGMNLVAVLGGA